MFGAVVSACGKDPGLCFFGTAGCSVRAVAMSVAHGASACVERRELGAAWRFEEHLLVSFFLGLKGCRDGSCPRSCAVGP